MIKDDREYRSMDYNVVQGDSEKSYKVEGYASTFDSYVLFTRDGIDYSERIDRHAFDDADMSDVVFRVDHEGRVYARSSAGTVQLNVDDHGLHHVTDLGRTARSRDVFDDIEAGNYPRMSFAFVVAEGGDEFDRETHTRIIHRVAKVFDISPVSFPANPYTSLSVATRDYFDGVIELEKAERLEREQREAKFNELLEVINGVH